MSAADHFEAGELAQAITEQLAKVKAKPTDQRARLFLFELFLFSGELDRAAKQLAVLNYDDPKHTAAVEQFRFALLAEEQRRAVFAGQAEPQWLVNGAGHLQTRLQALKLLAQGQAAEGRAKLDEANTSVPALNATVNGVDCTGLYDGDERYGTLLEVFGTGGVYCWVALEDVASITLAEVANPRDILWRPAHLILHNGIEGDVLLPGLYPNSHTSDDDELKLGRATDWNEVHGIHCGVGTRMLIAGDDTINFTRIRQVVLTTTVEV
jgi:type VI secretion system protein ImpE